MGIGSGSEGSSTIGSGIADSVAAGAPAGSAGVMSESRRDESTTGFGVGSEDISGSGIAGATGSMVGRGDAGTTGMPSRGVIGVLAVEV
jgi:hypothetical protein